MYFPSCIDLAAVDRDGLTALAEGRMTVPEVLELLGPPADRAAAGARQLDHWHPGWTESITQPIRVASTDRCPLGQVYGSYDHAPAQLAERAWWQGFCPVTPGDGAELDGCWTVEVNRRQVAQLHTDVAQAASA